MWESETYRKVFEEGFAEAHNEAYLQSCTETARRIVLRLATTRFGPPGDAARARLEAIFDPDRLVGLAERLLTTTGWDDLLADDGPG